MPTPAAPHISRPQEPARTAFHVCAGNQYGGVESMLVAVARFSADTPRLRHMFSCAFEGRFSSELRAAGAEVHSIPNVRFSRPWEVLRARASLRRTFNSHPPSIVLTHSAWARLVFGRSLAPSGTPTVAWIHGSSSPPSRLDRFAQRPQPVLVITNSRYTDEITRSLFLGIPRQVLTCPVPPPPADRYFDRDALRSQYGAGPGQTVVLIAARMEAWKGHSLLLEALARIPSGLDWICWIAGSPQTPDQHSYLDHLHADAARLGIAERLRFLGERKDIPQLMSAADIYCQPNSGPEPFGIVFIEALYAGTPVVTTRLGGATEIVTDACGRLVPPSDAGALGTCLSELIQYPEVRSRLGKAGPARAASLCDPARQITALNTTLLERIAAQTTPRS